MTTSTKKAIQTAKFCELAKAVIDTEAAAIVALRDRIDHNFTTACQALLACEGRIVVTGMGKSGHIGKKIAATLASTGTPAFFVHPGEANHGDMGMITARDVVIAISNSGETPELLTIIPLMKRLNIPLITLTGKPSSTLAQHATVNLDISVEKEACPLGLAPTSSTTTTLVMGDALAISLLEARGFTSNDFALFHPGGSLGRRLLLRTEDIMHAGSDIPTVTENCLLDRALVEMTNKRLGMTAVLSNAGKLIGIYTDGDLRRTLDQGHNIRTTPVREVMTQNCVTLPPNTLAVDALRLMEEHTITSLLIIDEAQMPLGVVHMHDLLRAGVV